MLSYSRDKITVDTADSPEDAEDIWLPVLAALQRLLNPG
jgi:hypothetical protein